MRMDKKDLSSLLGKVPKLRVAVIGDFCVDAYWEVDAALSERSV